VARLRELVLELAVRGKLVPQNSADEPAGILLRRVAVEKVRLSRGKTRPRADRSPSSTPVAIPSGWVCVDLDRVALVAMGNSPPGTSYNSNGDGVPLINGPVEFSAGPFGRTVQTSSRQRRPSCARRATYLSAYVGPQPDARTSRLLMRASGAG